MIKKNGKTISSVMKGNQIIDKIMKGALLVYESWKDLIASGVPSLTLTKCKGIELVDYKLYGNSVQNGTPTPEAPIEVESVGDKTKNLINENSVFSAKNIFFGVKNLNNYNTFEAGTYTFSVVCSDGGVTNLYITNADTNQNILVKYGVTTITFTLTETTNIKIKAYDNRFVSKDDIVSFQLEIGETSTEHEPYNKYKIPVKASGKNLLIESLYRKRHSTNGINCEYEDNGIFHIYGEHTAGSSTSYFYLSNFSMPVPLIGNEYYTYSAKLIEGTTTHNIVPYLGTKSDTVATKNWLAVTIKPNTKIGETITKTLKANYYLADTNSISNMWFYINVPVNETIKVDCRIQVWLEKGYEPSEYEPYVEPIITNIYLDEPLKSGEYLDYKKQQLVIDNIPTSIELPNIPTFKGTTILSVDTTIQPSNLEVVYKGKE